MLSFLQQQDKSSNTNGILLKYKFLIPDEVVKFDKMKTSTDERIRILFLSSSVISKVLFPSRIECKESLTLNDLVPGLSLGNMGMTKGTSV